jgi:hypothetical protein
MITFAAPLPLPRKLFSKLLIFLPQAMVDPVQLRMALMGLGIRVVDSRVLPPSSERILSSPESTTFVRPLTISGVLVRRH